MQVAMVLSCGLASLFLASAFAKVAYWDQTLDWFAELLPRLPQPHITVAVITAEVAIAVATVVVPQVGAIAATLWLLMASALLWSARREVASCGCFGLRQRLGMGVVIRNGMSILVAVAAAVLAGAGRVELLALAAVVGATVVVLREAFERKDVVV